MTNMLLSLNKVTLRYNKQITEDLTNIFSK